MMGFEKHDKWNLAELFAHTEPRFSVLVDNETI